MLLDCYLNFSHTLLLVCTNAIDFYILILYPVTLLNSLIGFWWHHLYIRVCVYVMQIVTVLFFLSSFHAFYFLFRPNSSGYDFPYYVV